MKKSTLFSLLTILVLIPGTLYLGIHMTGKAHYLTSTLIIIEVMLPFFVAFEHRKPQARELVTIAVMCALAVAARVVVQIPAFKPMLAVIMIAGIALGAEAGFLTGAISAFASNFFFSQGPWTPWQMMAYGFGGFLAGLVFHHRKHRSPVILAVFGFLTILFCVGPLLDTCSVFTVNTTITWKRTLLIYGAGFPNNFSHALACGASMLLLGKPLLYKLDRLKTKYGMLDFREVPHGHK